MERIFKTGVPVKFFISGINIAWDKQGAASVDHNTASEVHGNLSGKEFGLDIYPLTKYNLLVNIKTSRALWLMIMLNSRTSSERVGWKT